MKIFVAGDRYFDPQTVVSGIKDILHDDAVSYDSVLLPYPVDHIPLDDDTLVPTGMAWDINMDADYGTQGVREYYGANDTLSGKLGNCDILVIHGAALPASIIDQAPRLKLIGCMRGGPVNIAIDHAAAKGIRITNSPGKNAQGVAEFTIGLLLAHIRHIPEGNAGLYEGKYVQRYGSYDVLGWELSGKAFGLIGFGRIGQALAPILRGFGCTVYAYDPYMDRNVAEKAGVIPCSLEDVLRQSDVVSLHARGRERIMNAREFALMKRGAQFVNTSRGTLVDYQALMDALKSGHLGGAALDVFGTEPFRFYRELCALPNVTATPHMAGISRETVQRGIAMIGDEIMRFIKGEELNYEITLKK
jgi:Phosphoglycerate dehydrogenase and related dehydrogenases